VAVGTQQCVQRQRRVANTAAVQRSAVQQPVITEYRLISYCNRNSEAKDRDTTPSPLATATQNVELQCNNTLTGSCSCCRPIFFVVRQYENTSCLHLYLYYYYYYYYYYYDYCDFDGGNKTCLDIIMMSDDVRHHRVSALVPVGSTCRLRLQFARGFYFFYFEKHFPTTAHYVMRKCSNCSPLRGSRKTLRIYY